MTARPVDVRASAHSTVAEQRRAATCEHEWETLDPPHRLWGYLVVRARCRTCETYRGHGEHDATPVPPPVPGDTVAA